MPLRTFPSNFGATVEVAAYPAFNGCRKHSQLVRPTRSRTMNTMNTMMIDGFHARIE